MRAFFKHFGSKIRVSGKLPPPTHDIIIEPFAGAAGYSVTHAKPGQKVILYDTDERVCMIWDFLINATPEEILALPVTYFREGGDIRELDPQLGQAQTLLIRRWLGFTGAPYRLPPSAARVSSAAAQTWGRGIAQRLAAQVTMIRNWEIHQAPHTAAPDIEAHWHIDPPYQGNKTGFSVYKCEPPDYDALAAWCKSRPGSVTVHEQAGADWLPFETLDASHRTSRTTKTGKRATCHEVYWKK